MKQKILIYSRVTPAMVKPYEDSHEFIFLDGNAADFEQQLQRHIGEVDGIVGANVALDEALLNQAKKLTAIASVSVGYDKYDLDYLDRRGIGLTNTPDILTDTTADLAFTLMMCAARRVVELDNWTKNGHWDHIIDRAEFGVDVHHKTIGIIGMGRIGAAIARRAHLGFGMNVLYSSRVRKTAVEAELAASYRSLEQLLAEADFILPVVPLTDETRHLIGQPEFEQMKRSAIVVNVSRGPIIDETALFNALQQQRIFAAGLDVYQQEPLRASLLFKLNNVVTVPHIGSATEQTRGLVDHAAQHKTGMHPGHAGDPGDAVKQQFLKGIHIRHHRLEHVIGVVAGNQIALLNFRAGFDLALKLGKALGNMAIHADQDDGRQ